MKRRLKKQIFGIPSNCWTSWNCILKHVLSWTHLLRLNKYHNLIKQLSYPKPYPGYSYENTLILNILFSRSFSIFSSKILTNFCCLCLASSKIGSCICAAIRANTVNCLNSYLYIKSIFLKSKIAITLQGYHNKYSSLHILHPIDLSSFVQNVKLCLRISWQILSSVCK